MGSGSLKYVFIKLRTVTLNAKNIYITGNMLQCFKVQLLIYIFIYGVPKKTSVYEPCLDDKNM